MMWESEILVCVAEVAAPSLKVCILKFSVAITYVSEDDCLGCVRKCCYVRDLLCSVRNRVPSCGPLTARYAKRALTGQTALSVFW